MGRTHLHNVLRSDRALLFISWESLDVVQIVVFLHKSAGVLLLLLPEDIYALLIFKGRTGREDAVDVDMKKEFRVRFCRLGRVVYEQTLYIFYHYLMLYSLLQCGVVF